MSEVRSMGDTGIVADRTANFTYDDAIQAAIDTKKAEVPHLYGWKWYKWARQFFESTNRMCLLCAGNQASKSSSNIRKCIDWATDQTKWPSLWKTRPRIFFYFYPSSEVATIEVEKKWIPEFMPLNKNCPIYGWKAEYERRFISAIHFNSGVSVYFKTYMQKARNLQTATVHACFADEEMPPELYDEIDARLSATVGYFSLVFTATEGHEVWYRAMERQGCPDEAFKDAQKWVVSLYDCQFYEDGTEGAWPLEKIKDRELRCSSDNEIKKRVHGRFIKDEGLKYAQFSVDRHHVDFVGIPDDWRVYASVDIGSGRKGGLSSKVRSSGAIVFLAVNKGLTKGSIFKLWRGDDEETSAGDILEQYKLMKAGIPVTQACYDYNSREFGLIAERNGESFTKADKSRDAGEQTLNTLFRNDMLTIQQVEHSHKMVAELMSVPVGAKTRNMADDLTDALRYCVMLVPWDWSQVSPTYLKELKDGRASILDRPLTDAERIAEQIRERRGEEIKNPQIEDGWAEMTNEIDFWNRQYEGV